MPEQKTKQVPFDPDNRVLGGEWLGWENNEGSYEVEIREGKSLYTTLCLFTFLLVLTALAGVLYLVAPRLAQFHPAIPLIATVTACIIFCFYLFKFLLPLLSMYTGLQLFSLQLMRSRQVPAPSQTAFIIGKLLGISQDRIANSYVHLNNAFVQTFFKSRGVKILVLLPRCLQHVACEQKIFTDIMNCIGCGKCAVRQLKKLSVDLGIDMTLATGGSYARQLIQNTKPGFIVAVACERELLTGLKAIRRIPVIGIPNRRPDGPCRNTEVDVVKVEEILKTYR